jgi:hypothetical protein
MDSIATIMVYSANKYKILSILIPLILSTSCDAPRNNPLDPKKPDNTYYVIQGEVKTLSLPTQPVENVTVFCVAQALQTMTNAAGDFFLETLTAQDGWLRFNKSGYLADSTYIAWGQRKKIEIEKFLNSLPQLDSLLVYSVILNRYPSLQTEQVVVQGKISDRDNDIDSVRVVIDVISSTQPLAYNIIDKWYAHTFSVYDLGIAKVEQLVGHKFEIYVKDIFEHNINIGLGTVERIIRYEPLFHSPSGNEVTSSSPMLTWERFDPGFTFTYVVQIYTAEITPQLVWEWNKLDAEQTSYTVEIVLPPDEYFWVIWAIDEFGNRARSKPASFRVE